MPEQRLSWVASLIEQHVPDERGFCRVCVRRSPCDIAELATALAAAEADVAALTQEIHRLNDVCHLACSCTVEGASAQDIARAHEALRSAFEGDGALLRYRDNAGQRILDRLAAEDRLAELILAAYREARGEDTNEQI